ncbi:TIGR02444 family protein [Mycolicibacterium mageritense]|uniref:TIGR02444 family protein n=1 Tax=Mycolicibacterium mageritense TaxID=53462 RepID=UPI0013D1F3D6|nr:TIGR02444 family protein [Mycolicibacterium mageritense]MCC9186263.1 TIGR02444 family protein [Mycolicibacterium mageritense]
MRLPDFALRVHGADGVAQACVLLQDRFGLDVNLLLFAARVGTTGRLTPATLAAATERVAQWHAEIVRPLRGVRRRLKSGPSPAPSPATAELRDELKGLEIRAELIELDELDALVPAAEPGNDPVRAVAAALTLVVRALSDRPFAADEDAALATIAAAAVRVGSQ